MLVAGLPLLLPYSARHFRGQPARIPRSSLEQGERIQRGRRGERQTEMGGEDDMRTISTSPVQLSNAKAVGPAAKAPAQTPRDETGLVVDAFRGATDALEEAMKELATRNRSAAGVVANRGSSWDSWRTGSQEVATVLRQLEVSMAAVQDRISVVSRISVAVRMSAGPAVFGPVAAEMACAGGDEPEADWLYRAS